MTQRDYSQKDDRAANLFKTKQEANRKPAISAQPKEPARAEAGGVARTPLRLFTRPCRAAGPFPVQGRATPAGRGGPVAVSTADSGTAAPALPTRVLAPTAAGPAPRAAAAFPTPPHSWRDE